MKIKPDIKQKIVDVANTLVVEGVESPTNDQVRDRMGGGSLSHISPVMREWRQSKKEQLTSALDMPADLKKAIETALSQVWVSASKLASISIESVRAKAEEQVTTATGERDEALAEIARLEKEVTRLHELTATLKQEKQNEINQAQSQVHEKDTQIATFKARLEERDSAIVELKSSLQEATANNKELQGELIEIAKRSKG